MESFSAYTLIIAAATIVLISFFFVAIAKKTNIPSVLLLIGLGVGLQYLLKYLGVEVPDFFQILEILGILGLIMIVLEAALDLKLKRNKVGIIFKSFLVAGIGLGLSLTAGAYILFYMLPGLSWPEAMLYSTPLSILSSAIIIPSVSNLEDDVREFHIYESTFSDIIGIMVFYFLIQYFENGLAAEQNLPTSNPYSAFALNLLITLVIAVVISYLLLIIFQKISENAKLFVLISVLMLLYAVAKMFHLSPLIIILIFGLTVSNSGLFFAGPLNRFIDKEKFKEMEHGLHSLTAETAFIVRTFFFVIFGASILVSSLYNLEVLKISLVLVASIFILRFLVLKVFLGKNITPQLWIAPRGLITVLLFYAIPVTFQSELFDPGILLFIILSTGLFMTFGLIADSISGQKLEIEEKQPLRAEDLDEGKGWTSRVMLRLRIWYHNNIYLPVIHNKRVIRFKAKTLLFLKESARKLGVKPIFTKESKAFRKRLSTVIRIIRNPEGVSLKDNNDYKALKRYVYRVIFETKTLEGILFDIFIFTLIAISVAVVMIQSVGGISTVLVNILLTLEVIITIIFTIEYLLRLWTSNDAKRYAFSTFGVIDLLAILPLFLEIIFANVSSLGVIRLLRLMRIFRVLKLMRFLGEAKVLSAGLKRSANKIFVFLFFVLIVCTIMGSVMFVIEGPENGFTSIPRGVYWAVVTMTTVGYGDISPSTPIGQFIAMTIMILGYGVIAVPTGLAAIGVATEVNKQKGKVVCPRCKQSQHLPESNYCRVCGESLDEEQDQ